MKTLSRKMYINLESWLLIIWKQFATSPNHEQKESIAFVAATANSLIKMGLINKESQTIVGNDTISSYLITAVLFLIGNSQLMQQKLHYLLKQKQKMNSTTLVSCIISLATGKLSQFENSNFNEKKFFMKKIISK